MEGGAGPNQGWIPFGASPGRPLIQRALPLSPPCPPQAPRPLPACNPQFCYEKRESFILSGLIPLLCLAHLTGLMPELADKGANAAAGCAGGRRGRS